MSCLIKSCATDAVNRPMQTKFYIRHSFALLVTLYALMLAGCNQSTDLDKEIAAVDAELEQLPKLQPNMLCPTVGFGSALSPDPDHSSWLDIILPEPREIDTIVLIPTLLKNTNGELETLGFPPRFTIESWLETTPSTQHAEIDASGWLYQSIGQYDPVKHPHELVCELDLNQTLNGSGSGELSISLYYAKQFEAQDGRDLQNATGVTQVGRSNSYPSWAEQSDATGKHAAFSIHSRFDLSPVPAGATLFLRIGAEKHGSASIDNILINAPFTLTNGDFQFPKLQAQAVINSVPRWYSTHSRHIGTRIGGNSDTQRRILINHTQDDFPNPGASPVVFSLPPDTRVQKLRIHATRLQQENSWRRRQTSYTFSLNEVLLFDGDQNIALNTQAVSSDHENFPLMFDAAYAVDGYHYFPPVDPREVSSPDHEPIEGASELLFDLGQSYTLDEARFYPVDRSPQFSHVYAMGIGFPRSISLHIGNQPDRKAAHTTVQITTTHQMGAHPLIRRFQPTSGRYVWIEMSKGQPDPRTGNEALGFSEIELVQNGTNVLGGIQPLQTQAPRQHLQHLTNRKTSSGTIEPQKEWLLKLHRRASLERHKQALTLQQLNRAEKQRGLLRILQTVMLTSLLAALIITLIIRSRHRHNIRKLREKIGASLHDEVGANLSSIALSSEMLTHTNQLKTPEGRQLNDDITRVAQETATEIRLLSRFLEKQGVESNLIGQFRRVERQMLPGIQTRADFSSPEQFNALTATEKWELVLFLKEALHNIVKHAHATRVSIRTQAGPKQLHLEICDNGRGLQDDNPPPIHLVKRAKKLNAQLTFDTPETGGTTIQLTIPKKRRHKK